MPEHLKKPKAVLFDLYGTLIDILTDEYRPELWEALSRFLRYEGLRVEGEKLKEAYFSSVQSSQEQSAEEHPEIDVEAIFREILRSLGRPLRSRHRSHAHLSTTVTKLFRALSIVKFGPYPDALDALKTLKPAFKLGLISNAQRLFLETEMEWAGLSPLFDALVVSSDHGVTKPDGRLFSEAVRSLGVSPQEAIYVGDNAFRDVCGAHKAGIYSVLLKRGEYKQHHRDCEPDATFDSLEEMVRWLQSPDTVASGTEGGAKG